MHLLFLLPGESDDDHEELLAAAAAARKASCIISVSLISWILIYLCVQMLFPQAFYIYCLFKLYMHCFADISCSGRFWKKMEPFFGSVSSQDVSYMKQEVIQLDRTCYILPPFLFFLPVFLFRPFQRVLPTSNFFYLWCFLFPYNAPNCS